MIKTKPGLKVILKSGIINKNKALEIINEWEKSGTLFSKTIKKWVKNFNMKIYSDNSKIEKEKISTSKWWY